MTELLWKNGVVCQLSEATVSVEDRGFLFADGVYEVCRVYGGHVFALDLHLKRLQNSAKGIELSLPYTGNELSSAICDLIKQSNLQDGMIYLQATRGEAIRNHIFPQEPKPTVLFFTRELPPIPKPGTSNGLKLITLPDERWKRCWIKSTALLPNVLAKNAADKAGADEAIFVENNTILEGSISNVFFVNHGTLLTPKLSHKILPGITRAIVIDVARQIGVKVEERDITIQEAETSDEIFITSTTREIAWVRAWNGKHLPSQICGQLTLQLHNTFQDNVNNRGFLVSQQ